MQTQTNGTNSLARSGQQQEQLKRTPRDAFKDRVLAVASTEIASLFGAENGRAAAARVALTFRAAASTAKEPDAFYSCSPESVASAMATSAFTQIMPGGPFCGCYLIPKKVNGVQTLNWWINHRGIKTLARRAGQGIEALAYFPGDEVVIIRGRDWRVEVIEGDAPNRDDISNLLGFVYYVTDLETGALLAARKVSKDVIGKRRDKSDGIKNDGTAKDTSPWAAWPMEMAEKTVIKYAAGRGDIFFDDVGNMALSREAEAQIVDTTAEVVPARAGAAALGGEPAPRMIGTAAGDAPDYAAEQAALAERQRAEAAAVEEEQRRTQAKADPLARFNAAVTELGLDPGAVLDFAHAQEVDLASLTGADRQAFFNSIKPGAPRRKALDGFMATTGSNPNDDGGM